jgi:hypothetical protein
VSALGWLEARYSQRTMMYIFNDQPVRLAGIMTRATYACFR